MNGFCYPQTRLWLFRDKWNWNWIWMWWAWPEDLGSSRAFRLRLRWGPFSQGDRNPLRGSAILAHSWNSSALSVLIYLNSSTLRTATLPNFKNTNNNNKNNNNTKTKIKKIKIKQKFLNKSGDLLFATQVQYLILSTFFNSQDSSLA